MNRLSLHTTPAHAVALLIGALLVLIALSLTTPRPAPALPRSAAGSTWARNYGGSGNDQANAVVATSDGGYAVAGQSGHAWVFKLDADGNVTWQKTYGGSGQDDASAIATTNDGGYVVAGYTESFGAGSRDAWVFKLDANGNMIWQKTYGGSGADGATAIDVTGDGGYLVAGYTYSFSAPFSDAWALKLDANGNILWQKTYGGSSNDQANAVAVTGDGGYIIAGETMSFAGGFGDMNLWVLKLDASGHVTWQKTYGGSYVNWANAIVTTADSGYLVAGVTDAFGAGDFDAWVFKLDGNGNILWQKTYGGSDMDGATGIAVTDDGGAIVAGYTSSFGTRVGDENAWVLKLDANGNILWQKTYGGDNSDSADAVAGDGGYVVAGLTSSFGQGGYYGYTDAWVLKLDANGNIGGSCSVVGASSATAANSTATMATTSATPGVSVVTPASSSATSADSDATTAMQCYAEPPVTTATSTATASATPTQTQTPANTATSTPTRTSTATFTPSPTATRTPTATTAPGSTPLPTPWGTPYFLPYVEKGQPPSR